MWLAVELLQGGAALTTLDDKRCFLGLQHVGQAEQVIYGLCTAAALTRRNTDPSSLIHELWVLYTMDNRPTALPSSLAAREDI
jgi:hypothetical protein